MKWHSGRSFVADDVIWNIKRALDAKTGSATVGLMSGYMLTRYDTGEKDGKGNPKMATRLWNANADRPCVRRATAFWRSSGCRRTSCA